MTKPLTDIGARGASALTHTIRMAILWALEDGQASPSEIARRIDVPLESVSYHVRKLHELGLIAADEPEVLEGSVRHPYRRVTSPWISDCTWDGLALDERDTLTNAILVRVWRAARAALRRGGWHRPESHISRHSMVLDVEGFEEVSAILMQATRDVEAAERRASERLQRPDAQRLDATLVSFLFETLNVDQLEGIVDELNAFGAGARNGDVSGTRRTAPPVRPNVPAAGPRSAA